MPAEAEMQYLQNASKLAMYGLSIHPAKVVHHIQTGLPLVYIHLHNITFISVILQISTCLLR